MQAISGFWIIMYFVPASYEDIRKNTMDIRLFLIFAVLSPLMIFMETEAFINSSRLLGICPGAVMLLISVISRGAVGKGDALVVMWLGFCIGILALSRVLSLAWTGIFVCAAVKSLKGKKKPIPFIPFLGAAFYLFFAGMLFGAEV